MTAEERAFNYASTQKPTKLQVGEIAKHYNNGYQQAMQDFMKKAESFIENKVSDYFWWNQEECFVDFDKEECIKNFKNHMQNESEN